MDELTRLGLDVHKDSIAVAVLRPGQHVPEERVIPNTPEAVRSLVRRRGKLVACYEAGPTGYDTHRLLTSLGIHCDVIAPALIPRRPGRRVKTDRLDARNLVRLHRAGELTAIRVPTPQEEALRDLIRVREDLKDDRRRTQLRVKGFLLRQGRRHPGKSRGWTDKFDLWVRSQHFDEPAAEAAFRHYLAALDTRRAHLKAISSEIEDAAQHPPLAEPVARLRCFRGIDTLSAVTIAAEVCDFRRFGSATSFMAFTGLVPSEHSSGQSDRRGSITKTGNAHLRWALVEAAWAYRHRPAIGAKLRRRSEGQAPGVQAWHAQCRLCSRSETGGRRFRKPLQQKVSSAARDRARPQHRVHTATRRTASSCSGRSHADPGGCYQLTGRGAGLRSEVRTSRTVTPPPQPSFGLAKLAKHELDPSIHSGCNGCMSHELERLQAELQEREVEARELGTDLAEASRELTRIRMEIMRAWVWISAVRERAAAIDDLPRTSGRIGKLRRHRREHHEVLAKVSQTDARGRPARRTSS